MMDKENTFTSDPFSVMCFELKKRLEIISTEIKPPKKSKIKWSIVRTRSLFSILHPALNGHVSAHFSTVNASHWRNKMEWGRKVKKGKKKEKAGPHEGQDVLKNGSKRKPRKRLPETGRLQETIL